MQEVLFLPVGRKVTFKLLKPEMLMYHKQNQPHNFSSLTVGTVVLVSQRKLPILFINSTYLLLFMCIM